jgi:hypothetical protein
MNRLLAVLVLLVFGCGYTLTGYDDGGLQADRIRTNTTNFDNNLSAADDNVQKALDTLDDMVGTGTGEGP